MGNTKTNRALAQFRACFDKKFIEELAVSSGFTRRFRKVRPFELVLAGIATLSRDTRYDESAIRSGHAAGDFRGHSAGATVPSRAGGYE